jgi:aminocarboxymuconate-semialdehyde decarboxylase
LLYFDSITHSDEVLDELVRRFGTGRVMLGSDYPAGMGNFKPGEGLAALGLDEEGRTAIASGNAVGC